MKSTSRWTIISTYTGLIIAFAAIILVSSALTSRRALLGHARNIMTNIASYTTDKSSNYLLPARDAARLTRGLAKSNILSQSDTSAMEAYFYEQLFIYPQFSGIYYGTVEGDFIMASRYNKFQQGGYFSKIISHAGGKRTTSLVFRDANFQPTQRRFDPQDAYDPRKRPWFIKARENRNLIWTAPYVFFTSKKPGITTANPVYDADGNLRGVIGVDIALDELSIFLSRLTVSENGLAFIMNTSGDVVAYPDLAKLSQPEEDKLRLTTITELDDPMARKAYQTVAPKEEEPLALDAPTFTTFEHDGQTYHAMFAPFRELDWPWVIGIYLPEDDYLGTIKKNGVFNIAVGVIAVLLGGLFGLFVARRIDAHRREAEKAAAAKSHFLARMSHEIRTPMNALLGASELLSETQLTKEQSQYLKLFHNAGSVLNDLVNDVLDYSAIEAGKVTIEHAPFSLLETLDETCSVLSLGASEKGLTFSCKPVPNLPERLMGDSARIKQVLVNLIANAIKFTDQGGIDVTVEAVGGIDGDRVMIAFGVHDTGIGIPEELQETVFQSFTQVSHAGMGNHPGTGLGLAISRHLVELMGGRIDLTSSPGKGSTFRVTLPLMKSGLVADGIPRDMRVTSSVGNLRVLLVDKNETNRFIHDMLIRSAGHTAVPAARAEEALKLCRVQTFDLVLVDLDSVEQNGEDTIQAIRAAQPGGTPPAMVAVLGHESQAEAATQAGFDAFLVKPVNKGEVLELLETIGTRSS